jgi:hypothetical protein
MIQQIDKIFMTIIGDRHAKRFIYGSFDGLAYFGNESEGANIGGQIGRPERSQNVLIGEQNATIGIGFGQVLKFLYKVLTQAKGIPFGTGSQEL